MGVWAQGPLSVHTEWTDRRAHHRPPSTRCQASELRLCVGPASVASGFINRPLMKVTQGGGRGQPSRGAVSRRNVLVKCVMRDITNPQYWAKLSLNPLMIVEFSLVHRTDLYRPFGVRGGRGQGRVCGAGGVCLEGLFLEAETLEPNLPLIPGPFSLVAEPCLPSCFPRRLGPRGRLTHPVNLRTTVGCRPVSR